MCVQYARLCSHWWRVMALPGQLCDPSTAGIGCRVRLNVALHDVSHAELTFIS